MDMIQVMMALAYIMACGPVTGDMRVKLDNSIQALTPDERWIANKKANELASHLYTGSESDLLNYPPSVRADIAQQHAILCEQSRPR
jgi:hypothetical protein